MLPGQMAVAIGIGVNVVSHPVDTPYPATSLNGLALPATPRACFWRSPMPGSTSRASGTTGRARSHPPALALARRGLGGEVAVRVDGDVSRGIFETIDEECRFVIRQAGGRQVTISAGDVHFGAVASARMQGRPDIQAGRFEWLTNWFSCRWAAWAKSA
jgi:BirA family biotin operon repressor/biotin-[acetyl-CoA-carboxylase] ligase